MTIADTTAQGAGAAPRARLLHGSNGRLWHIREQPDLRAFAGAEWPPLISTLLAHRDAESLAEAEAYLGEPQELTDPQLMPNLDVAVARLASACRAGETVAVFGDYDVDGVTSATILVEGLRALGARPVPYLPHRFTEGYGPNVGAVRHLRGLGATLLVTADCGTSAVEEVAVANELGMEVIILDHHVAPSVLPDALAIVNPKLTGSEYGSEPAACGVAYKVVHDLHDRLGAAYDPAPHRALVALGTICDLAPLVSENRDLVRIGLEALQQTRRPGLVALAAEAGVKLEECDPEMCGWALGPRINAAGRMDHARIALELMLAEDATEAKHLAMRLEELNRQRRAQTQDALTLASELLSEEEKAGPLLVVATPDISSGIVGLAASRLVEQYHRPAIVMQLVEGEGRASCRSIPGFDITALLQRHGDLFKRFGGHRAAAGFTIDASRLAELRARLVADAGERLDVSTLAPTIEVDAELPLHTVNGDLLRWLQRLGPHGQGNPAPTFLSPSVEVRETRTVGQDGSHLQFTLKEGRVTWRAISFRNAEFAVPAGERADIVYTFRRDNLRGTLQLEVLDLRPAEAAS
ncbi:MAG: single-stranded-DNA-specific exonuclease RecJ [Dehalococcoidia bacterium]